MHITRYKMSKKNADEVIERLKKELDAIVNTADKMKVASVKNTTVIVSESKNSADVLLLEKKFLDGYFAVAVIFFALFAILFYLITKSVAIAVLAFLCAGAITYLQICRTTAQGKKIEQMVKGAGK
ncbi:MAG: hypothetical protein WC492_00220 [Candidatus Micrarchaeia archaeon]